jgi:hypothetical protein
MCPAGAHRETRAGPEPGAAPLTPACSFARAGIASLRMLSQRREEYAGGVAALLVHHSGAISQGPHAAATAAALCWGLRCLESILGRAATFALPPAYTGMALQCASAICLRLEERLPFAQGEPGASERALALVAACSGMLVAAVRHRAPALLRCAHLLTRAVQQLLLVLLAADRAARQRGQAPGAGHGGAVEAAELALARLLEAAASHKQALSKYCMHMVADYVTYAACNLLPASSPLAASPAQLPPAAAVSLQPWDGPAGGHGLVQAGACPAARSGVLRRAMYAVFGGVRDADLQHLHVSLGRAHGQARRGALKQLQKDYERLFKFTGKV